MSRRLRNLAAATGVVALTVGVAVASAGVVKKHPSWTLLPSDKYAQDHEGELTFDVRNLSDATFAIKKSEDDGQSTKLLNGADDGEWLTKATPFADYFGPTGPGSPEIADEFLSVRIDYSKFKTIAYSTYVFDKPIPADSIGFVLGDIDVDQARVTAEDKDGNPLSGAQLRGQVFNFCEVPSDKPDACFDNPDRSTPIWTPQANGGLLLGDADETEGASGFFRPSVAVSRIRIIFEGNPGAGRPSYRTWFGVRSNPIGGKVTTAKDKGIAGAKLFLISPSGQVRAETTSDENGKYEFPGDWSLSEGWRVKVVPPDGWKVKGSANENADNTADPGFAPFVLVRAKKPGPKPDPKPGPKPVTG